MWNDGWDGYGASRRRLTDALRRHRTPNPVFLGGDVHENWVGQVMADYRRPEGPAVGVEFCGTSITSRSGASILMAMDCPIGLPRACCSGRLRIARLRY